MRSGSVIGGLSVWGAADEAFGNKNVTATMTQKNMMIVRTESRTP